MKTRINFIALLALLVLIACRVSFTGSPSLAGERTWTPLGGTIVPGEKALPGTVPPSPGNLHRTPTTSPTPPTPPTPTASPTPSPTVASLQEFVVTIPAPSLKGNLIGERSEQTAQIYLPPSYDTSALRYPVVYFLPGFGSDTRGHGHYFSMPELPGLMKDGSIKEMIMVVPNGANLLGGSFYVNSPVTGNWEDFITQDVVGYIDANYRTIAAPEGRGIAGHSMGGFGALNLAMRHPDLFSSVYGLSSGLFDEKGLSNSQMFDESKKPRLFLERQEQLASLSTEDAILEMIHYEGAMRFTLAYGAAFAPNVDLGPPFFVYPYAKEDGEIKRQRLEWQRWEKGLGDWKRKIADNHANLARLSGIVLDYGRLDSFKWITSGSEYVAKQLNQAGIPARLYAFDGDHNNMIQERILEIAMPFFSEVLEGAR